MLEAFLEEMNESKQTSMAVALDVMIDFWYSLSLLLQYGLKPPRLMKFK